MFIESSIRKRWQLVQRFATVIFHLSITMFARLNRRLPLFQYRRYASPVNVRFIQSKSTKEEILARYKEKLVEKAHAEGVKGIEELKDKFKEKLDAVKKDLSKVDPLKELDNYEKAQRLQAALDNKKGTKKDLGTVKKTSPKVPFKTLESYVKADKFTELDQKQIELIWRARFIGKDRALCACVPADTFDRMYKNARKWPRFVLPVPHDEADVAGSSSDGKSPVEMHFVQWSFVGPQTTHVMVTSLAEYQMHKEYARPHTTVAFHEELEKAKGLVLMNGQVDPDAAISMHDVKLLLMNLQRFYGGLGEDTPVSKERLEMVRQFNEGSKEFNLEKLIESAGSLEN